MVICAVVSCHNHSDRGEKVRFFRLLAVITHQGTQVQQLGSERQQKINTKDLTPEKYPNVKICSQSGSPAPLFDKANPDWAPTLTILMSVLAQLPGILELKIDQCEREGVQRPTKLRIVIHQ